MTQKNHEKDTPKDTPQATPASRRKSDVKITNWVIGYLDDKEKFRSDFKLKGFVRQIVIASPDDGLHVVENRSWKDR